MKEDKLTSVKVINRSLDLFVYDEEFQKKILDYDNLEKSGSKY